MSQNNLEKNLNADEMTDQTEEKKQADQTVTLAANLMALARDVMIIHLRFFAVAVYALMPTPRQGLEGASTDGKYLYYDPVWLIRRTGKEPAFPLRLYLHCLLHLIFFHGYGYDKIKHRKIWDLAVDLAVENVIAQLSLPEAQLAKDAQLAGEIEALKEAMNPPLLEDYAHRTRWEQSERSMAGRGGQMSFTAENIYEFLLREKTASGVDADDNTERNMGSSASISKSDVDGNRPAEPGSADQKTAGLKAFDCWFSDRDRIRRLQVLSHMDEHVSWEARTEVVPNMEAFRKIAERVKADLKSFSKAKSGGESLLLNLSMATRQRADYAQVLSAFAVYAEDMKVSEDEFDYIFYTYGLREYGNMPLIEPLEYTDEKKIRDFVIVIDTSASCRKGLVEDFLKKTVQILGNMGCFFTKVNIHLLQCDDQVRSDTVITDLGNIDELLEKMEIRGLGATDFRPAFAYVDKLIEEKKLTNLRGLIYFTDGYGVYPEAEPAYKSLIVFTREDESRPAVPVWAAKVVLE